MKKIIYLTCFVITLLIFSACSSRQAEDKEKQPQEEAEQEVQEEGEETEEESEEERTDEDGLPKGGILFSALETEPVLVEDLDEKNWIKITNEDFVDHKIIYGAGEAIVFKLNRTYRYDVESEKQLWELKVTSPDELISLEDGVALTTGFKIREIALKDGKVLSEIEFKEEEVERYIQYNEPYRLGDHKYGIRVTNEDTEQAVDILDVEPGEYVPAVLLETKTVTLEDEVLKSFDNETGEQLAEREIEKKANLFKRVGTDEFYAVYSPVENQYGYQIMLIDAETLETKNEIFVKEANGDVMVTDAQLFYYDVINGELVALDMDLTKENYRMEIGGELLEQNIHDYDVYEDKLYLHLMENGSLDKLRMLEIDSVNGEVEQDLEFPSYNLTDFYKLDNKLYLKFESRDGDFYYIVDQEDVHRSMD